MSVNRNVDRPGSSDTSNSVWVSWGPGPRPWGPPGPCCPPPRPWGPPPRPWGPPPRPWGPPGPWGPWR